MEQVALGAGLSTSFLSLVENGRSDISTGRLFRVARSLGVGLGDLLEMEAPRELTIVRADERRAVEMPGEGLRMLPVINDHEAVAMAPVICELEPGAHLFDLPRIEGVEHFLFVVRGGVEIIMQDMDPFVLECGDCAYVGALRASELRSGGEETRGDEGEVRNAGDGRAVVIWVTSPPALGRDGRR